MMAQLQGYVSEISSQLKQFMSQSQWNNNSFEVLSSNSMPQLSSTYPIGNFSIPASFTKINLPKFGGDDVKGWIYKCERFFTNDNTPEHSKVKLASLALEGRAYIWHQTLEYSKSSHNYLSSWEAYALAIYNRFGSIFEDPSAELMKMRQEITVDMKNLDEEDDKVKIVENSGDGQERIVEDKENKEPLNVVELQFFHDLGREFEAKSKSPEFSNNGSNSSKNAYCDDQWINCHGDDTAPENYKVCNDTTGVHDEDVQERKQGLTSTTIETEDEDLWNDNGSKYMVLPSFETPYFITNHKSKTCEIENSLFLIYKKNLPSKKAVAKMLELALMRQKPLLTVAEEVGNEDFAIMHGKGGSDLSGRKLAFVAISSSISPVIMECQLDGGFDKLTFNMLCDKAPYRQQQLYHMTPALYPIVVSNQLALVTQMQAMAPQGSGLENPFGDAIGFGSFSLNYCASKQVLGSLTKARSSNQLIEEVYKIRWKVRLIIWGWYYKEGEVCFNGKVEDLKLMTFQRLQSCLHPGMWNSEWRIAWSIGNAYEHECIWKVYISS